MGYGIVLREVEGVSGLKRSDVIDLFDMLDTSECDEAYPIELEAYDHECVAMGFITPDAANEFDYDWKTSGLHDFIANILDDMNNESETCEYEFKGIKIWLSR